MTPLEPVIRVKNICKTYTLSTGGDKTVLLSLTNLFRPEEKRTVEALKNVSFDVLRGEVLGILGPNGAGKTTLLMVMAGILPQDSGEIESSTKIMSPFLRIGSALHAELTVEDNIRLCGALMGLSRKEVGDRMVKIIDFGELWPYRYTKLAELSSGFQSRVAFSTALHTELDTILVDETLSVGDMRFRNKCMDAFTRLITDGKTIVLTSHSMADLQAICKRCLYLSNGEMRAVGPTQEVIDQFTREYMNS